MTRRRRWRDLIGLLLAALQFALPLAVSYADGRLAADGGRARPHVESDRSSNCGPVHSPECGLCRFLVHHSAASVAPATLVDVRRASRATLPRPPQFARLTAQELPRSRGPPIA